MHLSDLVSLTLNPCMLMRLAGGSGEADGAQDIAAAFESKGSVRARDVRLAKSLTLGSQVPVAALPPASVAEPLPSVFQG
jgi:hypothetical protein